MKDSFGTARDTRRKVFWALIFVVIAAASVFAVSSASKGFSYNKLKALISGASPVFIILAFLGMLGHIFFEGLSLKVLLESFGQKCTIGRSFVYSCTDLYFSAITPSATGGQPVCAYFMIRDGIPGSCVTVCLIFNLAMYTLAIIIIGAITLIVSPHVFLFFGIGARILILLGAVILCFIAVFFILIAVKASLIDWFGELIIKAGLKLRIIKSEDGWPNVFRAEIINYKGYASMIGQHKSAIVKALILNVIQRACQFSVTMFMYIAINLGRGIPVPQLYANGASLLGAQSLISLGSTFVPIPGAMGYTDLMMLNGFEALMSESDAAALELMSRGTSFYCMVLLCFIITAAAFIRGSKKDERS